MYGKVALGEKDDPTEWVFQPDGSTTMVTDVNQPIGDLVTTASARADLEPLIRDIIERVLAEKQALDPMFKL